MGHGPPDLTEALGQLQSVRAGDALAGAARSLLSAARHACEQQPVDLDGLAEAARSLLTAFEATDDQTYRRELRGIAHTFIDLARSKTVRQAAYPSLRGGAGQRWVDGVLELVDRTDFTLGCLFRQRVARYPDKTLFVVPTCERVREYSWESVAMSTERIAAALLSLLGDDPVVAIFTPNRVEGALVDLACLTNGIYASMIPANAVESQLEHILVESRARAIVVSGADQLQRALLAHEVLPSLKWVITLNAIPTARGAKVMALQDLLARDDRVPSAALEERMSRVRSADIATTMYTSGTTGSPKGIKFSQLNLVSKRYARAAALPDIDEDEVFLCYLPLYHTFGRYLEMLGAVHLAATYIFAESASTGTLVRHMQQFHPTAMISVPKKWVDLHQRIVASDEPPDDHTQVGRAVAELTGGRLRWGLSAAGRLDPAVFRFFQYHGIDLLSGYGMTEATGGITMTPPGGYVEDSIGKALPGIELGFGDDGELKLRGPYVTPGYTDQQDNEAAIKDGWFHTGDIVNVDDAGFLRHVDRKKDIYKNASGRTIAPQRVEALFADFPEISRVFAVGDGREYVTLLIRPNLEYTEVEFGQMTEDALREYFRGLVVPCNRFLAPFERVVSFALIDRDFTIEDGELTPKGSFRRAVVEEHFRDDIEPMYASSTINRMVDGIRVKIPIAFLQHLGATETGTYADGDGLVFSAVEERLRIRRDATNADRVWIGNCCYEGVGPAIELNNWLRVPRLWVGNGDLTQITGDSILLWSLSTEDHPTTCRMVEIEPQDTEIDGCRDRMNATGDTAPSLLSVHAAAVCLSSGQRQTAIQAVEYIARVITAGWARYQELAEAHLLLAARHADPTVRSRAFVTLWQHQSVDAFSATTSAFCQSLLDFLDDDACVRIAGIGFPPDRWAVLRKALESLRQTISSSASADTARHTENTGEQVSQASHFAIRLLRSLGKIADLQEEFYLPVRQELTAWTLAPVPKPARDAAGEIVDELTTLFRRRLGPASADANDPQTGRRYTWADTVQFEDGIDPGELRRIAGAMWRTNLVREAVYLLHRGRKIDLPDLAPESIWVSPYETRFGRSVYHVGVRLRSRERCDFTLYVRSTAPQETFLTDLRLMCLAAGVEGEPPLTPQLGGYWPEFGLASLGHIAAEPVEVMVRHMHEHPDRYVKQRLKESWHHLSWSALTAAFEFHRRTERQWMLTGPVARDIGVPLDDYHHDVHVFSVAGWRPFSGTLDMILRLKRAFLDRVRFHFSALAPETHDEVLFAAAIEAFGLRDGVAFLTGAIAEAEHSVDAKGDVQALYQSMKSFVDRVESEGYMPRAVHFAIKRYHSWAREVPDADVYARAAQLRELQSNYGIDAITRSFPGSRLWLYAETVLKDSPPEGRQLIDQAIRRLRGGGGIRDVLGQLYRDLQDKLAICRAAILPHARRVSAPGT